MVNALLLMLPQSCRNNLLDSFKIWFNFGMDFHFKSALQNLTYLTLSLWVLDWILATCDLLANLFFLTCACIETCPTQTCYATIIKTYVQLLIIIIMSANGVDEWERSQTSCDLLLPSCWKFSPYGANNNDRKLTKNEKQKQNSQHCIVWVNFSKYQNAKFSCMLGQFVIVWWGF